MSKIEAKSAEIIGEPQENLWGRLVAWVRLTLPSGATIESKGQVRVGKGGQVEVERGGGSDRDVYTGRVVIIHDDERPYERFVSRRSTPGAEGRMPDEID